MQKKNTSQQETGKDVTIENETNPRRVPFEGKEDRMTLGAWFSWAEVDWISEEEAWVKVAERTTAAAGVVEKSIVIIGRSAWTRLTEENSVVQPSITAGFYEGITMRWRQPAL